jgi:dephospho-CoA kinase
MKKVGITGGIGSGKSMVCRMLETLGVPVYNADMEARQLINSNQEVIARIKKEFGEAAYDKDGNLHSQYIADLAFNDRSLLESLNNITHPFVRKHFNDWVDQHQEHPYLVKEAAIMFESGSYLDMDLVINVYAPEDIRIQRTIKREGMTSEKVKKILNNQVTEKERIERSAYVLINDEKTLLAPQVIALHQMLLVVI